MKLISCHIENFGKISNKTIDFSDNLNTICEDNGWGKTTLATFIKVMFFGFTNERSRDELLNERKKYKPWQGGAYGGSIIFEAGKKQYLLTRSFGIKDKEDEFVLRDLSTNLESEDFSSNIGEELFQIDSNSFTRTVFISQNSCETSATGSINAKIGNLTDNTDDINNFETVNKRLTDILNNMSPSRKTGSISKIADRAATLTLEVKTADELDMAINEYISKKEAEQEKLSSLKDEQSKLVLEKKRISKYKDLKLLKDRYNHFCKECEDRENKLLISKSYFKGEIPEESQVNDIINNSKEMSINKSAMDIYRFSDAEKDSYSLLSEKYMDKELSQTQFDKIENECRELKSLNKKIEENKLTPQEQADYKRVAKRFDKTTVDEHTLELKANNWINRNEKKSSISVREANLETLRNNANNSKDEAMDLFSKIHILFAALSVIFLLSGVACIFVNIFLGVTLLVICAATFGMYIIADGNYKKKSKLKSKKLDEQERKIREIEEEIENDKHFIEKKERDMKEFLNSFDIEFSELSVIDDLYSLKADIALYKRLAAKCNKVNSEDINNAYALENNIREFLNSYNNTYDLKNADVFQLEKYIYEVKNEFDEYCRLTKKKNNYINAEKNYNELSGVVMSFFEDYGFIAEENIDKALLDIKEHIHSFKMCLIESNQAVKQKEEYVKNNNITDEIINIEELPEKESMAALEDRLEDIAGKIENINSTIINYNNSLNLLREKRDIISEKEEELLELNENLAMQKKKYKLIKTTAELLEKAKNSLTSKYMEPILNGLKKYYRIMTKEQTDALNIDADINITVNEEGMQRKTELLSAGSKDLINICLRMSLIDAMYKEEKPFIIFDDPFVNLDEEKVKGGLEFLQEISKEYQVIYFTCHSSRKTY